MHTKKAKKAKEVPAKQQLETGDSVVDVSKPTSTDPQLILITRLFQQQERSSIHVELTNQKYVGLHNVVSVKRTLYPIHCQRSSNCQHQLTPSHTSLDGSRSKDVNQPTLIRQRCSVTLTIVPFRNRVDRDVTQQDCHYMILGKPYQFD